MTPLQEPLADALRPTRAATEAAWRERVAQAREQLERQREFAPETGPYPYSGDRFRVDPSRPDDAVVALLRSVAHEDDVWLDIGAGVGRYALPLARFVGRVVALEPEAEALSILQADAETTGIEGIETLRSSWPPSSRELPLVDGVLMAHVGYGVDEMGPFLDAAEALTRRVCVAVMGEGPMAIVPRLLWAAVHGEVRRISPALPELLAVLVARGVLPDIRYFAREPVTRLSVEGLVKIARRQLWVQAGSAKDDALIEAVQAMATERDDGWALEWARTRIGIVSWEPIREIS
jgi:hypothetical protein